MKLQQLAIGLIVLTAFSSCQSFRTITAKDTTASQKSATARKSQKNVKFIDGIEVTPGTPVTSRHKTINTGVPKKPVQPTAKNTNNTDIASTNPAVENASYLQLKYAVMLNATVEKLTNTHLLEVIDEWWGTRYCLGGSTKSCIDCSAFTTLILKDVYNVSLPRTAREQFEASDRISVADLQEGDLVFFAQGKRISHVGVYITNNKFVHAATSGGVMISDLNDKYWNNRYKGGGRLAIKATSAR